ncbi:MAG: hypothetical protein WA609_06135, partial [Terriglobales bacterium]
TQDIDLVIEATPAKLSKFIETLPKEEYYVELETALEAYQRRSMFNVIDLANGWKIDLIIRKSRAFSEEEFRRRQRASMDDVPIFVASVEDSILSKLEWAKLSDSRRQIDDVAAILRLRWDALDHSYLQKWVLELGLTEEWSEAKAASGIPDGGLV